MNRSDFFKYIFENYYKSNYDYFYEVTGYSNKKQIDCWLSGQVNPRKTTIDYFLSCTIAPEFKIIKEYFLFKNDDPKKISSQLKEMLGSNSNQIGIYCFYDAFGNLIYLGKASTSLSKEIYQALQQPVDVKNLPFPDKKISKKRYDFVSYISAYDVGTVAWGDYPKHVESLILRISKPKLNKIKGSLSHAYKQPEDF